MRANQDRRKAYLDILDLLQWPAMGGTIAAAWLVASTDSRKRNAGFWVFLLGNALWIAWALYAQAPALIAMQIGLAAMNIRGALNTDSAAQEACACRNQNQRGR
jgi:hypothetical protein